MDCPCAIKRQKRTASSSQIVNCMNTASRVRGGFKINCHPCHLTPQLIGYYAKYRMFVPLLCNKSKSCFPHSLHRKGSNEIIHLSPEKLFYNYL